MSKYNLLWEKIGKRDDNIIQLSFSEIENILGFKIDHSFLNYKKELVEYGYKVRKISLNENWVKFEKIKSV